MFKTEGEMYSKVKDFFIKTKKCDDSLTWYTNERGAKNGKTLIIKFGDSDIKPDVYGVKTSKESLITSLAEGKNSIRGSQYDIARGQALANQRFCHFSYLFFPESEFEKKEMVTIVCECKEHGLGLLKVPCEREMNENDIIVEAKISPQIKSDDEFLEKSDQLISGIRNAFGGKFKDVYPNLIRDFIFMVDSRDTLSKEEMCDKFISKWDALISKGGLRVLDPMRMKALREKGELEKIRLTEDIFTTSLLLELIKRKEQTLILTEHGKFLKRITDENKIFQREVTPGVKNFLAARMLNIYPDEIYEFLNKILEEGKPLCGYTWCNDCGYKHYDLKKFWDNTNNQWRCPTCQSDNLSKSLKKLLDPKNEGKFRDFYSVEKFLVAVGIFSKKTYKQAKREFPDIEDPPDPRRAGRLYYTYIGEFFMQK